MKIFLGNTPWRKPGFYGVRAGSRWPHFERNTTDYLPFPFFLAYATALLRESGYKAMLVDGIAEDLTFDSFLKKIKNFNPDLIVLEVSTPSIETDLRAAQEIKFRLGEGVRIAFCGLHVFMYEEGFLKRCSYVDFVLRGEYEYTLLDLVDHIKSGKCLTDVKGIIYRKGRKVKVNKQRPLIDNLDRLPWPARDSLPMHKYKDTPGGIPQPSVQMLSTRGCPYKCIFCAWPQIMYKEGSYRERDPVKVIDEMEYLVRNRSFKSVYFDDDTFNLNKQRILKICSEIRKRNLQDTPWAMMARPDLMDEEILISLKEAGLFAVKYGVESGNQELLDKCGKNMDLGKSKEIIKLTKKMGIKTHLTFTFGLPGETNESAERTIDTVLELDPESAQYSITTPYPGTKFFYDLDKKNRIITKNWDRYDGYYTSVINTEKLSAEQLLNLRKRADRVWKNRLKTRDRYDNEELFVKNYQKFKIYFRNKGLVFALIKTFSYFIFLVKYKYLNLVRY